MPTIDNSTKFVPLVARPSDIQLIKTTDRKSATECQVLCNKDATCKAYLSGPKYIAASLGKWTHNRAVADSTMFAGDFEAAMAWGYSRGYRRMAWTDGPTAKIYFGNSLGSDGTGKVPASKRSGRYKQLYVITRSGTTQCQTYSGTSNDTFVGARPHGTYIAGGVTGGKRVPIDQEISTAKASTAVKGPNAKAWSKAANAVSCGQQCAARDGCKSFAFNSTSKICSLHSNTNELKAGPANFSAGTVSEKGQYSGGRPGLHQYPTTGDKFTCPIKYPGILLPRGQKTDFVYPECMSCVHKNLPCDADHIAAGVVKRGGNALCPCQSNRCELKTAAERGRTAKNSAAVRECCKGAYTDYNTGLTNNSYCPPGACPWGELCEAETVKYCSRTRGGIPLIAAGGDKNCINWCKANPGSCDSIKMAFCAKNPTHQLCACLAPKSSSAYANFMKVAQEGMSTLGLSSLIGNYECWWPGCVGTGNSVFRTQETDKHAEVCPANNVNICAQIVKIPGSDVHIDKVVFKQVCKREFPKPEPVPAHVPIKPADDGGGVVPAPLAPADKKTEDPEDDSFWGRIKKRRDALADNLHTEEDVLGITDYLEEHDISQTTVDYALAGTGALLVVVLLLLIINSFRN